MVFEKNCKERFQKNFKEAEGLVNILLGHPEPNYEPAET